MSIDEETAIIIVVFFSIINRLLWSSNPEISLRNEAKLFIDDIC